jgi:transketolase
LRNEFAKELKKLGESDNRVVALSGDIGNRLFDKYKEACPGRFFNCGVAEANMMGVAAGLAMNGFRPFTYTITPFTTTRCLEQIRLDICYHNAPVVIIGTGAGLSYADLGPTHHSCEDVAFLRMLPGMIVICPCDNIELRLAMRAALKQDHPVYIRIGKKGEPLVHCQEPDFIIGKAITLKQGDDICLIGTGTIMPLVLKTAEALERTGFSVRIESFHSVKPLDQERLEEIFSRVSLVATVEEHNRMGGLGGSIAEWYVDQIRLKVPLLTFGTGDWFLHEVGSQEYARIRYGLTVENLTERIQAVFKKNCA